VGYPRRCVSSNSFQCHIYGPPRKCGKQKTYSMAKPFRCNIYTKHRVPSLKPKAVLSARVSMDAPEFERFPSTKVRIRPCAIITFAASPSAKKASQE